MAGSQHRISNILGYAGLIPFVVPALLVALESEYSDLMISAAGKQHLAAEITRRPSAQHGASF